MKHKYLLAIVIMLNTFMAAAQTSTARPEILTNGNIIKLVKAGLTDDIIITKIETTEGKFDLTEQGLIGLKAAKVSNDVIKAMMGKGQTAGKGAVTKPSAKSAELELANVFYMRDNASATLKPLEKANATQKATRPALGFGGMVMICQIPGGQSPVRITASVTPGFVINTGGSSATDIVLFKLETRNNTRSAVTSKVKGIGGGMKGAQGVVACNQKIISPGVYEFTPEQPLEAGEYFFTTKAFDYTTMANMDVFAFGIDQ